MVQHAGRPKQFLKEMLEVDITSEMEQLALDYHKHNVFFFHPVRTIDYLAMFKHTILEQRIVLREQAFVDGLIKGEARPLQYLWRRNFFEHTSCLILTSPKEEIIV